MANNTEQSLKDEIWAIKHRSVRIFHNDHNDGDLAVYSAIDEMAKLLEAEATRARIDVLKKVLSGSNPRWTHENVVAELKRQAEGGK